ncbi:SRPBCC family protein [Bosea sp. (in: a-proteobacteria)]|uniref:SRPBCC family protein n=1 Tax=Bosea sp. (in: a-proteobacteria) TaxID=1871050 RepID=UPI0025C4D71E|nr:SRPBCC family protein [Bosea sp. (in: a-proteobacteria)]MBR3192976.1 SRPBCC family protein [Bosea sp. (in: a-proteobacteria)]
MPVLPTRHISIAIDRPVEEVYGFLADPMNFPKWAEGLGGEFVHVEGMTYHAKTPMGPMRVMFSEPNRYGVLDHAVIPDHGAPMHNPMRTLANGSGSEVMFTLFRRPEMTDDEFARDAEWVAADLARLKALLES